MNRATIYTRTDKGAHAAAAASAELARDWRDILHAIDGKSSVEVLRGKLDHLSAARLDEGLAALAADGLIRATAEQPGTRDGDGKPDAASFPPDRRSGRSSPNSEYQRRADDLRAKIRAKREGVERPPSASEARDSQSPDQVRRNEEEQVRREAAEHAEAQARRMAEEQARRGVAEEEARLKAAEERARQEAEALARQVAEAQARRDAEERVRRETEERVRRETEERVRRETEERVRRETEERVRQETAERVRRETEEQARLKAAERARQEAEEHSRREAEERLRREAEERLRREAEERLRRDAEEQARRDADDEARREAAERARQEAEEEERQIAEEVAWRKAEEEARRHAGTQIPNDVAEVAVDEAAQLARMRADTQVRLMAEEQAWLEAEEKIRREEEAAAGKSGDGAGAVQGAKGGAKRPRRWGKMLAWGLVSVLVAGLVVLHLISFDEQIPQFEKLAAGQFQQPVKISKLHLSLLPLPHLRFEGVSIGSEGQIKVPRIKATGELGNLFNERKVFKSVELDSPVFTDEGLGWVLFGKSPARDVMFGHLSASNATLESKNINLPAFDAKLEADGEGAWKTIVIDSVDKNFSLELTAKGQSLQFDAKAKSFKVPFGSSLTLDELVARGTADRAGLAVADFRGFIYGGTLSGSARLKWGTDWSLAGELNAKQIDTTLVVPELLTGGRLAGAASYVMQAPQAVQLFAAPHVEGNFTVPWGTLLGVDLGRMLQGGERRGETKFTELGGSFVHDRGTTQLRQLRLSQATLSATGSADVDADKNVRGRFVADLRLSTEQRRANLSVSGPLGKLDWQRQ